MKILAKALIRKLDLAERLDNLRYKLQSFQTREKNAKFRELNPTIAFPPDYLMYEAFMLDYKAYIEGGLISAKWLVDTCREYRNEPIKSVLDWGCGPGRIVRHMPELLHNTAYVHACAPNAKSIAWCSEHLTDISFHHSSQKATLPYDNGQFDLIYGISILTHLSEENHRAWIEELTRVMSSGGILILTTQGNNYRNQLSPREQKLFDQGNLVVQSTSTEGHRSYAAYQPPEYMRQLLMPYGEVDHLTESAQGKNYKPQDRWVLRKT